MSTHPNRHRGAGDPGEKRAVGLYLRHASGVALPDGIDEIESADEEREAFEEFSSNQDEAWRRTYYEIGMWIRHALSGYEAWRQKRPRDRWPRLTLAEMADATIEIGRLAARAQPELERTDLSDRGMISEHLRTIVALALDIHSRLAVVNDLTSSARPRGREPV